MSTSLIALLRSRGWSYAAAERNPSPWVPARYGSLPGDLKEFLESFSHLQNGDETQWFIAADDFRLDSSRGFAWNEFERMSLDAAVGDPEWRREIQEFWTAHIPVLMSVAGSYSYVAYCCAGENNGRYVSGSEPEFEEVAMVATDLPGLLAWLSHKVGT